MRIVLIDPNGSDRTLASKLLQFEVENVDIVEVAGHADLVQTLGQGDVAVVVCATQPGWITLADLQQVLRLNSSPPALIVWGQPSELGEMFTHGAHSVDGVVSKTSAGFCELAGAVSNALERQTTDGVLRLNELPVAAFFADNEGLIVRTNESFDAIYGNSLPQNEDLSIPALCADADAEHSWHTLADGRTGEIELQLSDTAGSTRLARIVRGGDSTAVFFGMLIEGRSAELSVVQFDNSQANEIDTQEFAMVFSHDLKEPIQQIVRLATKLDDQSDSSLMSRSTLHEHLKTSAARAASMLDGILDYLSVSSRHQGPDLIDLDGCLEEALDNLRTTIDDNDARIVSDHLPSILGDRFQFVHLFQNLISNGIKFRGREKPEIRITSREVNGTWRIAVRDNGIGIAEPHRERIFEVSQRLHTREEYPGHGLGLALCRRICTNHGGSIRVEGNDSGGSTFVVEIPNRQPNASRRA